MEVLYFFNATSANFDKGDWIKLGRSLHLTNGASPYRFRSSGLKWPCSEVVYSTNVILGKNGRGKTTALNHIFSSLPYGNQVSPGCAILLKDEHGIVLIKDKSFKQELTIDDSSPTRTLVSDWADSGDDDRDSIENILSNIVIAFIDPTLRAELPFESSVSGVGEYHGSVDLRSSFLIANENSRPSLSNLSLTDHYFREMDRDLEFLSSDEAIILDSFENGRNGDNTFEIPRELFFRIRNSNVRNLRRKFTKIKNGHEIRTGSSFTADLDLHESFSRRLEAACFESRSPTIDHYARSIKAVFIASHLLECLSNPNTHPEYFTFLKKVSISRPDLNEILHLLQDRDYSLLSVNLKQKITQMNEFMQGLASLSKNYRGRVYFPIQGNKAQLKSLLQSYRAMYAIYPMLNFQWRTMSGGQTALLKIFSRLYSLKNQLQSAPESLIILLDEPDTYLHPEWERKLLKHLIVFCEKIFSGQKVQLVLTTNKPFCLSDLTNENLTILSPENVPNDGGPSSFCNRITDILGNEFFMTSDVGELAADYLSIMSKQEGNVSADHRQMVEYIGDKHLKSAVFRWVGIKNEEN